MASGDRGGPIDGSYWALPGQLLAGPYPGEYDLSAARRNFQRILDSGIRTFVSLMEAHEEGLPDGAEARYLPVLRETATRFGHHVRFARFPIHDMSVPRPGVLESALLAVQSSLDDGSPVYVHCWGGRGRTGTLVGSWLIRNGLATRENFVEVISALRPHAVGRSPETDEQVEFVRQLSAGEMF